MNLWASYTFVYQIKTEADYLCHFLCVRQYTKEMSNNSLNRLVVIIYNTFHKYHVMTFFMSNFKKNHLLKGAADES